MAIETPTALGEIVVSGDKYVITITFTKDGATFDLTGYTVTCTVVQKADTTKSVNPTVAVTTPASGILTATLSIAQSSALLPDVPFSDYMHLIECVGDCKAVEDADATNVIHSQPFSFSLRRGITA